MKKKKNWNMDCVRSCFWVAGYSATLILVVFLAEILQGSGKGKESVYAMSQQREVIHGARGEVDGVGSKDWWFGDIRANLDNVLKSSMYKYLGSSRLYQYGGAAAMEERQGPLQALGGEEVGQAQTQDDEVGQVQAQGDERDVGEEPDLPNEQEAGEEVPKEQKERKAKEVERVKLSKEDKKVLLRIVEAEATGEGIKGKMLVANVVLNRVNNKQFPDTVKKVVFQKDGNQHQFSPISDGRYWKVRVSKQTRTAIERVLDGEDDSQGALYFMCRKYAKPSNVRWFDSKLKRLYQYGAHEFYK